jgi:pimeloyl-ACP methyl ester carboxylesterase
MIAFDRLGSGEPLLLLHGTGLDRRVWEPVLDGLSQHHELLAVDLPGHGQSPIAPPQVPATPLGYARLLAEWLDDLGIDAPHVAGNSVGGWTALELAKLRRARSVTALGPAGLWARRDPLSAKAKLWLNHQLSRHLPVMVPAVLGRDLGRKMFLAGVIGDPSRVPADAAIHMARSTADAPDFSRHLRETTRSRFSDGGSITVPVTIAWGEKERLVPKHARRRDQLPPTTRWQQLPGCGHIPFWDAPELVISTILETTTSRAGTAQPR